jgi:hypothetical protein
MAGEPNLDGSPVVERRFVGLAIIEAAAAILRRNVIFGRNVAGVAISTIAHISVVESAGSS